MKNLEIPTELAPLKEMAMNYYWSWTHNIWPLYERVNPTAWKESGNPIQALLKANPKALKDLSQDKEFIAEVNTANKKFTDYMADTNTWYNKNHTEKNNLIAYFSAEFGIHEALPIYSGGLGVLSGDHIKSSSDLGIPMICMGLFYKNGYFIQQIDKDGKQVDVYIFNDPEAMSLELVRNADGTPKLVSVDLCGEEVFIQTWKAAVGRSTLYLLDTNVDKNSDIQKDLTAKLYGGDRDMRMSQEIVLGIGGIRVIKALELRPTAYHMNEGHSGFFQLERVINAMKTRNLNFEEAKLLCSTNCVFTTHTPVPAGNETFDLPLVHKYFYNYAKDLGISWNRFLDLGLVSNKTDWKYFSLTIFAINFSRFHNGVSELHGDIAKKMWKDQWSNVPEIDNPITYITNGVHVKTWTSDTFKDVFDKEMGQEWMSSLSDSSYWEKAQEIPNDTIRTAKNNEKNRLITMVRSLLKEQLERNGESEAEIAEVDTYLNPDALTIGFARRFATYKRATLIFKDEKRLASIINNSETPVQFIFAGKAHPADIPGQKFIEDIYKISRKPEFKGKVIILENYDMSISRRMVSGVDVWLNNPRRPMEASGTSGQKVPLNFGLNFSTLDGWWREGYNEKNGWTIGLEKDYPSDEVQDFEDANDFYKTLEETVLPLYYNKKASNGSDAWMEKSKESLISNIARYSTYRMVQDYMQKLYTPAIAYGKVFREEYGRIADYIKTRRFLKRNWNSLTVTGSNFDGSVIKVDSDYENYKKTPSHHTNFPVDATLPGSIHESVETGIELDVYLGDIDPKNVLCELVVTSSHDNNIDENSFDMVEALENGVYKYKTNFKSSDNNAKRLRVRFIPTQEGLNSKFEFRMVTWL